MLIEVEVKVQLSFLPRETRSPPRKRNTNAIGVMISERSSHKDMVRKGSLCLCWCLCSGLVDRCLPSRYGGGSSRVLRQGPGQLQGREGSRWLAMAAIGQLTVPKLAVTQSLWDSPTTAEIRQRFEIHPPSRTASPTYREPAMVKLNLQKMENCNYRT